MTVADRLDGLMETKGIKNRSELARLSGIPYTTIVGVYEKNEDNLTLKTLTRLSRFFGCSLDYLATGIETEEIDPAIHDLIDAAKGNDREDIRRAADQLRRMKAFKTRMLAYYDALHKEMV